MRWTELAARRLGLAGLARAGGFGGAALARTALAIGGRVPIGCVGLVRRRVRARLAQLGLLPHDTRLKKTVDRLDRVEGRDLALLHDLPSRSLTVDRVENGALLAADLLVVEGAERHLIDDQHGVEVDGVGHEPPLVDAPEALQDQLAETEAELRLLRFRGERLVDQHEAALGPAQHLVDELGGLLSESVMQLWGIDLVLFDQVLAEEGALGTRVDGRLHLFARDDARLHEVAPEPILSFGARRLSQLQRSLRDG